MFVATKSSWHYARACSTNTLEETRKMIKLFFSTSEKKIEQAQKICAGCTVRTQCREEAEERGEDFGVWGGVNFANYSRPSHESFVTERPLFVRPKPLGDDDESQIQEDETPGKVSTTTEMATGRTFTQET